MWKSDRCEKSKSMLKMHGPVVLTRCYVCGKFYLENELKRVGLDTGSEIIYRDVCKECINELKKEGVDEE